MTADHGGRCLRGLLTGTEITGEEFRNISLSLSLSNKDSTKIAQSTSKREDENVELAVYLERLAYFINVFANIW